MKRIGIVLALLWAGCGGDVVREPRDAGSRADVGDPCSTCFADCTTGTIFPECVTLPADGRVRSCPFACRPHCEMCAEGRPACPGDTRASACVR